MNLQFRFNELFAHRRGNNLFAKLIAGCLALVCLCCCGYSAWFFGQSITPSTPALAFVPDSLMPARVGEPYSARVTVTNNRTAVRSFSIPTTAPPGLTLKHIGQEWNADENNTALLSGIPTQVGTYTFTISARCYGTTIVSGQVGEKKYTIVVDE